MSRESLILEAAAKRGDPMYLLVVQNQATKLGLSDSQYLDMLEHIALEWCDGCEFCGGRPSGNDPLLKVIAK